MKIRCKNEVRKRYANLKQKWAKREPKWRPKCIQNSQKEPKGSQRGTKRRKMSEKRHAKNDAKIWYRKWTRKVRFLEPVWLSRWTLGGKEGKPPKAALRNAGFSYLKRLTPAAQVPSQQRKKTWFLRPSKHVSFFVWFLFMVFGMIFHVLFDEFFMLISLLFRDCFFWMFFFFSKLFSKMREP